MHACVCVFVQEVILRTCTCDPPPQFPIVEQTTALETNRFSENELATINFVLHSTCVCVCVHPLFIVTVKLKLYMYKYIAQYCLLLCIGDKMVTHSRERLERMSSLNPRCPWQRGCGSDEHCQPHPAENHPHLREREWVSDATVYYFNPEPRSLSLLDTAPTARQ